MQSKHDTIKYVLLAYLVPFIAFVGLVYYVLLAHVFHLGYPGAYWALVTCVWGIPLSAYLTAYRIQLKQRYHRLPLLANLDENDEVEADNLLHPLDGADENEYGDGAEEEKSGFDQKYETLVKKHKKRKQKSRRNQKGRSVSFGGVTDIDDVFGAPRFYLSKWGVFGIALSIIGLICGVSTTASSFFVKDILAGVWALLMGLLSACSLYCIITHESSRRDQGQTRIASSKEKLKLVGKIFGVFFIIIIVVVTLLSAIQACALAYNMSHFAPPGKLYTVDKSGSKLHMHCVGEEDPKAPAVLFHHSLSGHSLDWSWIQPEVAKFTKACSFDRTGFGWSDAIGRERTSDSHADELHALLVEAGMEKKQFIFVGHATSSIYMNAFIHKYVQSTDVCGMVCLDCVDYEHSPYNVEDSSKKLKAPFEWDFFRNALPAGILWVEAVADKLPNISTIQKLPEKEHPIYLQNIFKPAYSDSVVLEYEDFPTSVHQTLSYGALGDMPFTVVAAGKGLNNSQLVNMSVNSTLVYLPDAPHDFIFMSSYASLIVDHVKNFVQMVKISGFCNTYLPNQ